MLRSKVTSLLRGTNRKVESKIMQGGNTCYYGLRIPSVEQTKRDTSPLSLSSILSMLNQGGRVFVLDMNSFLSRNCGLMGAQSLSLCADMPLSLNPFTGIPEQVSGGGYQIRNNMDALLRQIILYMSSPLSDSQKMYVDQSLNHSWLKEGSEASIDTIVNFLLTHEKKEAHEIGQRLEKFSSWGNFGCLFEGPSQLNLSGPFHSVNFSQLWVYPPLRSIVLQFLLLGIFQEMTKHLMQVSELPQEIGDGVDASRGLLDPVLSTELTHTPFLIHIEDSQEMIKESKLSEFMKMYRSLIIKHHGKIVVTRGVI